ncbi:MAG: alpha/beta hydrolase [Bacteroidales bacterium]|nr:alpha/beta hydrolase [Bacteroidales bacterium]MDD4671217.1 alpha/beta hydrolase [Bacteroidales bacterium]
MKHLSLLAFIAIIFVSASCGAPDSIGNLPSRYIKMDSVSIHYKTFGTEDKTIVFVHGFGCDMNAWSEQFLPLQGVAKMVFIDLPGFGQSDKPHTDYTLDYFAKAVKTVLDELNISNALLVGHSLGTPVCREVIFDYPDLAGGLCDVDGVYCLYPEDSIAKIEYEAQVNGFAESFKSDSLEADLTAFTQSLFGPSTPQFVKDYALSVMPETESYIAYSTMFNLIQKKYWTKEVISVPSLIICTKNSGLQPDNRQQMESLYTNMQYEELDATGHFIMMEEPEWLNNLLITIF